MKKHKQLDRRTRSFRVFFGGMLAIMGISTGMLSMVWCQHELTMGMSPNDITVQELNQSGPQGNSFVRITDVYLDNHLPAVSKQNSSLPQNISGHRSNQGHFQLIGPDPTLVVIPINRDPQNNSNVLFMRGNEEFIALARKQLKDHGALFGHVGRDEITHSIATVLGYTRDGLDQFPGLENLTPLEDYPYVFRPIHWDPNSSAMRGGVSLSSKVVCGCLIMSALGIAIAGSGAPSVLFSLLFTGPAIVSIPGYFLRYGRGNSTTRMLYVACGLTMVGGAYYLTFWDGEIFDPAFSVISSMGAYLLSAFGYSAIFGAVFNSRFGYCLDAEMELANHNQAMAIVPDSIVSEQIQQAQSGHTQNKDSAAQGIMIEPSVKRYHDALITIADDDQMSESMELSTAAFHALEFDLPLIIDLAFDGHSAKSAIQAGCGNMVLAVTSGDTNSSLTRLFSVLENGQVITTLSPESNMVKEPRSATGGIVWEAPSDDPRKMLSSHLERTAQQAESFATQITTSHPSEWRDLFAYTHRVFADIGHQFGDNPWKVHQAEYGRFRFPVQPVASSDSLAGAR